MNFSRNSLYNKELFCTFAHETGYRGGDNSPLVCYYNTLYDLKRLSISDS